MHRLGLRVPKEILHDTVDWALSQQDEAGLARGWAYVRKSPDADEVRVTGSMTTGGVATLLAGRALLQDLDPRGYAKLKKRLALGIYDGLAWIDLNWSVERNPPADEASSYHLMHLWGLERVGGLLRSDRIGTHDWYAEGAAWLVKNQKKEGCWDRGDTHPPSDLVCTCFALLFLGRATRFRE